MNTQVKTFDFPSFEEWFEERGCYYKTKIGNYTAEISKLWPTLPTYCVKCSVFLLESYKFDFNHDVDIKDSEKLTNFKKWYEESCVKINQDFKNYICRTYFVGKD